MSNTERVSMGTVKAMLARFASGHATSSRATSAREFGDLLLYLVRLADKAGVDLIAAGEQRLAEKADRMPKVAGRH